MGIPANSNFDNIVESMYTYIYIYNLLFTDKSIKTFEKLNLKYENIYYSVLCMLCYLKRGLNS